jgi:ribosome biogenesis protein MAK21
MKGLDFKGAGVEAPSLSTVETTKQKAVKGEKKSKSKEDKAKTNEKGSEKPSAVAPINDAKSEKKAETSKDVRKSAAQLNTPVDAEKAKAREIRAKISVIEEKVSKSKQSNVQNGKESKNISTESKQISQSKGEFLLQPTARWAEVELGPMKLPSVGSVTADEVEQLQKRGAKLLDAEKHAYLEVTRSGRGMGPGMLSSSDARFISELLAPGSKGGTLSDRVAALTLLAQSSPVHNMDAMESLLTMAGKKGREESGRATRALADWLASGGGLSQSKLRYLRDHPSTSQLVNLLRNASLDQKQIELANAHLLLATFEDKLKRFYFQFIQILETQSHDTLPFVRKQAVTQIYLLLKEKSEQEQNLLRLLVNKLGDTDRAVASKASSSLLNILTVHPNMKTVITNEVSSLILKPSSTTDDQGKAKFNSHARYYGTLTLNQTMLTSRDEAVANRLVTLYFELFENVLDELNKESGGREEKKMTGEEGEEAEKPKKDKQRWRDAKGKKGSKKAMPKDESKVIQDADAKTMAAILTGVRRALPFARVDGAVFEKHMTTLFRITHSSTFNISIQALQLIFQVSLSNNNASSSSQTITASKVEDRFYRALYASLLDPRLATTSKQAMYLNLLFKAIKADNDDRRVKAFVKRFVQTLNHGEPPWICGGLFLLGELMTALPGLKTLLDEAEDDGEEHFVDAVEGSEEEGSKITSDQLKASQAGAAGYDPIKREPQFAKAESSCLWEIAPLMSHFHPSVSLHARQLLQGQKITTTADLTLNTLAHFLDRFVYRNPKKNIATSKGASIMQPAANTNDARAGLESGVVKLRGVGVRQDEFVNNEKFWKKKVQEIPVDQLFFHKYFTQRISRSGGNEIKPEMDGSGEDDDSEVSAEEEKDHEESSEGSEDEEEILKEMKRTMPRVQGDELMDESDVDDDDEEMIDYSDSEEDVLEPQDGSADESDENVFDEDEEDLLPFNLGEESEDGEARGIKRGLEDGDSDDEGREAVGKSKSQLRREERKKRKALPTFASADDYAHLLNGSDDEEGDA